MIHALTLEVIGDDSNDRIRQMGRLFSHDRVALRRLIYPEPWVARITGTDPRFGFRREFVRGEKDYTQANSVGSRSVMKTFWLTAGNVYEVCHRTSWRNVRRYYCRVDHEGARVVMTEEEVRAWLASAPSE